MKKSVRFLLRGILLFAICVTLAVGSSYLSMQLLEGLQHHGIDLLSDKFAGLRFTGIALIIASLPVITAMKIADWRHQRKTC